MKLSAPSRGLLAGVSTILIGLLLAGCQSTEERRTSAAADAAAVDKAVETLLGPNSSQKGEGFEHAGDGVLIRWATAAEKQDARSNCISGLSCFIVSVAMNGDCPSGIYIELKLKDSSGNVVGMANERTPAMSKGDRGVFAITGSVKAPKAAFSEINCH